MIYLGIGAILRILTTRSGQAIKGKRMDDYEVKVMTNGRKVIMAQTRSFGKVDWRGFSEGSIERNLGFYSKVFLPLDGFGNFRARRGDGCKSAIGEKS